MLADFGASSLGIPCGVCRRHAFVGQWRTATGCTTTVQPRHNDVNTRANRALSNSALPVPPARPGSDAAWALFLDFDGTLVDLAATPHAVVVPARLCAILSACAASFDGAVAIVSGRPIAALDALLDPLLDPLRLPAAGLHGLELRMPDGTMEHAARAAPVLAGLRTRFLSLAREDPRLLVEDKGSALALHFRRAPEREEELRALVCGAAGRYEGHHVLHGKKVVEVRPARADKGDAVARFLQAPPFSQRRPVFAGDDVTDEDGFAAVNRLGGISVKVGAGATEATCRVPDVAALHDWLAAVAGARGHG